MIEKMVPLVIPPGVVKNGTMFQRAGRWADGNLVRFHNDVPRAVRTFLARSTSPSTFTGTPLGAFGYTGNAAVPFVAMGTTSKLYELECTTDGLPIVTDITPTPLTGSTSGQWQFDLLGTTVVACLSGGTIVSWTIDAGAAAVSTGSPNARAMGVTPERFLVAAGLNGLVSWASQGTVNTWTPASTNSAGSLTIPTGGVPMAIRRVGGRTLLWTSRDVWSLNYVGAPLYYGASLVTNGAGLVASRAVTVVEDTRAYWMTERGFKVFDGYVREVPCDIADDIFPNLSTDYTTRQRHTFAVLVSPWNEIWWFYPSTAASGAADKVAIFNYANGTWCPGSLIRTAGADAGTWVSLAANNGDISGHLLFGTANNEIYFHEALGAISGAYLESGPFLLDAAGNKLLRVQKLVPDNNQATSTENITLYAGTWPKVAETNQALVATTAGGELDVRLSGRYIRYKQELTREDSRIGTPRIGITQEGSR